MKWNCHPLAFLCKLMIKIYQVTSKLFLMKSLDLIGSNFSVNFCTACSFSELGFPERLSESPSEKDSRDCSLSSPKDGT